MNIDIKMVYDQIVTEPYLASFSTVRGKMPYYIESLGIFDIEGQLPNMSFNIKRLISKQVDTSFGYE